MSPTQSTLTSWRMKTSSKQQSQLNSTNQPAHSNDNIQTQNNPYSKRTQRYTDTENQQLSRPTNKLRQSLIHDATKNGSDIWGHIMPPKTDGIIRIGVQNINSLPVNKTHSKNDIFIQEINNNAFDVFCATEINVSWTNLEPSDKLQERFRGKLEFAKFVSSHNLDKNYKDTFQRGGTMTVCSGPMCARVVENGNDKRRLGRWSRIKLRGCKNRTLVIVTLYRPVYSQGALSTYQQQKSVLLDDNVTECPRQVILTELEKDIKVGLRKEIRY
jgi:hypothetical protein